SMVGLSKHPFSRELPRAYCQRSRKLAAKPSADVSLRRPGDLVERRDSVQDLAPAVLPQRNHAFFERLVANLRGVDTLHAHLADRIAGNHQLEDPRAAAESSLATGPAAGAFVELDRAVLRCWKIRRHFMRLVLDLALGANRPHQALCHHSLDRAGNQEGLDSHVDD